MGTGCRRGESEESVSWGQKGGCGRAWLVGVWGPGHTSAMARYLGRCMTPSRMGKGSAFRTSSRPFGLAPPRGRGGAGLAGDRDRRSGRVCACRPATGPVRQITGVLIARGRYSTDFHWFYCCRIISKKKPKNPCVTLIIIIIHLDLCRTNMVIILACMLGDYTMHDCESWSRGQRGWA